MIPELNLKPDGNQIQFLVFYCNEYWNVGIIFTELHLELDFAAPLI